MSGVNPQGVNVHSFKVPAGEEVDHDYMWRNFITLPRRGNIGIFTRSYNEEVLVVRVHPEFLAGEKLPPELKDEGIWKRRFEEINNFEKYLVNNGIVVVKFFLYVSKDEQKKRFLERINLPEKNWKFSVSDVAERGRWDDYLAAYQDVLNHTSTAWAPWYIIPADKKWFSRLAVAEILYQTLKSLNLAYPTLNEDQERALLDSKAKLESEGMPSPSVQAMTQPVEISQPKDPQKKDKKKNKRKSK
jgi:PPK2 family polyphosphate:nucleotide phosphotransferase